MNTKTVKSANHLPDPDEYSAKDYPDPVYSEGTPVGPKDTGSPSFMGVTEGGKYVPLGRLREAQAEEDKATDAAGDAMREDVAAAAHRKH